MMDEFARMMSMEGVRPLDRAKESSPQITKQSRATSDQSIVASPALAATGHMWATGARARTALETAIERLATEIRNGRRGWSTGIRQDGTTVTLPASSGAAALLGAADRQALRLMIAGGDGWTFVMHPLMALPLSMRTPPTPHEQTSEVEKPILRAERPLVGHRLCNLSVDPQPCSGWSL